MCTALRLLFRSHHFNEHNHNVLYMFMFMFMFMFMLYVRGRENNNIFHLEELWSTSRNYCSTGFEISCNTLILPDNQTFAKTFNNSSGAEI